MFHAVQTRQSKFLIKKTVKDFAVSDSVAPMISIPLRSIEATLLGLRSASIVNW
jgi:hypothetical protein